MPGTPEFSLGGPLVSGAVAGVPVTAGGRSFVVPQQLAPMEQQQLETFLQSPQGGRTPAPLAHTIAGNVAQHPQGNPYIDMMHKAQMVAPPTAEGMIGAAGRGAVQGATHPMQKTATDYVNTLLSMKRTADKAGS